MELENFEGWRPPRLWRLAAVGLTVIAGLNGAPLAAFADGNTTDVTVQSVTGDTEQTTSDENLTFSTPTVIPFTSVADGTLTGPSADAVQIKNKSVFPIHVTKMAVAQLDPFHVVDDVSASTGTNDIQFTVHGAKAAVSVDLSKDATWNMGYAGSDTDHINLDTTNGKIARVTADLSKTNKVATITWILACGAAQNPIDTAIAKNAADWTLDDQKAIAEDISAKGEQSAAYAKTKAAMDAGTTWSVKLTNGETMTYRIIGINHDDQVDGSGKAGLTFEATNSALGSQRLNATDTNVGGWEKSELRERLNSGDLWSLLPTELTDKVKGVVKTTDNKGGGSEGAPSATTDKVFLLSMTEVYGNFGSDGTQYEYFETKGVTSLDYSEVLSGYNHWTRSVSAMDETRFCLVGRFGNWANSNATGMCYVFPAFCF